MMSMLPDLGYSTYLYLIVILGVTGVSSVFFLAARLVEMALGLTCYVLGKELPEEPRE